LVKKRNETTEEDFYALKIGAMWRYFKSETFAFWMICFYLFFEYVRPQSIIPELDFLPWTQLSLLGALMGWLFGEKKKWVSSPLNKLLLLFLITVLISSFNSYWPSVSFANLKNIYVWILIYFLIINIITTKKRFLVFLAIFVLASFKISLSLAITWAARGFSFTGWGLQGPPGFFQNSGELAIQMVVFWPIAFAVAISFKAYLSTPKYLMLITMPVSAIMVILGASSRGGQLALLIQLIVANFRKIFRIKVIVILTVVLTLGWWLLPQEQKTRFESAGDDVTSQQRLLYWENGLKMMESHPFLGVGYFNFIPYYDLYYSDQLLVRSAQLPHNIFIQVGTDLGFSGLFVYFLMIFYSFMITFRAKKAFKGRENGRFFYKISGALNISLVGFLVAGQFVSVVYYPFLWIHFAIVVCLDNIAKNHVSLK